MAVASCEGKVVSVTSYECYTGMDKTRHSGSLFVRDSLTQSGCPRHVGCNYVPLFGVAQSNVDLRYNELSRQIVI